MAEENKVTGGPTNKKQAGKPIDLQKKITVYSTDKDPHHATGDPINLHPETAAVIVKRGLATMEPPAKDGKK